MKGLIIFIGICVLFACKTKQNSEVESSVNTTPVSESEITNREYPSLNIVAVIGDLSVESKNVQILKSKIEGNNLILKIGYSGGCSTHEFEFIGSAMISKSLPPIRSVKLIHRTDDTCREYIERQLVVDLKELAYKKEAGSQIKLNIGANEGQLVYTYH
jgi:hypothetical protein